MKTKIFIATQQKPLFKVKNYIPLSLGTNKLPPYGGEIDSTGNNISHKNINYCELTGYYWLWKNYNCDNIGLIHYRRALISKTTKKIIETQEIDSILQEYDVILPKKNYYTKKYKDFYHLPQDFKVIRKIIADKHPEYLDAFDYNTNLHHSYICNIMITNKKIFDNYCEWLFGILDEFDKKIKYQDRDSYSRRAPGFVAEFLLGIYLKKHAYKIYELPMRVLKTQNKSYSANNFFMNYGDRFYSVARNLRQFALKLIFRNN